ncbi:hypothetical protein pdam_00019462 [Pocillopora damicornis]|uniref:Uncharacterized protein n=1 Tax=Pocillopora damicornis TaxID=46731 RepID=A0A3M6T5G6_POCDA|nr:hypothetical protein pdam_00019462 [Pocillopora damicornis]
MATADHEWVQGSVNSGHCGPVSGQRTRGTVGTEEQWEQRNSGNRGIVGTEDQWNSGHRGLEEQ